MTERTSAQTDAFEAGARAQRAAIAARYRDQAEVMKRAADGRSREAAVFLILLAAEISISPLVTPEISRP